MMRDGSSGRSTGRGYVVGGHLNSPVCVMVSDVYRFVPVATRYVSALVVARLCAQTAQAAIINLCALCSRGDAESRWVRLDGRPRHSAPLLCHISTDALLLALRAADVEPGDASAGFEVSRVGSEVQPFPVGAAPCGAGLRTPANRDPAAPMEPPTILGPASGISSQTNWRYAVTIRQLGCERTADHRFSHRFRLRCKAFRPTVLRVRLASVTLVAASESLRATR